MDVTYVNGREKRSVVDQNDYKHICQSESHPNFDMYIAGKNVLFVANDNFSSYGVRYNFIYDLDFLQSKLDSWIYEPVYVEAYSLFLPKDFIMQTLLEQF